jgi:hypothetical protein
MDNIRSVVDFLRWPEDLNGGSALHMAVRYGLPREFVEFLCERCPWAIREAAGDSEGVLPLHCVGPETPVECIEFLIGRYPASLRVRDKQGRLPVHATIDNMAARGLIQNQRDAAIMTREYAASFLPRLAPAGTVTAARPNQLDTIRCVVRHWPESLHERSGGGSLPLHHAIRSGMSAPIVQFLLDRLPEACPDGTRSGMLHYAIGFA